MFVLFCFVSGKLAEKEHTTSNRVPQLQVPIPIPVHHQQHQYVDHNRNQDHRNQDHRNQHHNNRNYHHSPIRAHQHHSSRRNEPIVISDGEGSDPIEAMDDNYDPGLPGYYYGGYGTCHRCGEFGFIHLFLGVNFTIDRASTRA